MEKEPWLMHQCPGCWSVSALPATADGYECECGERLTLIDLRARTTRPLNEDER